MPDLRPLSSSSSSLWIYKEKKSGGATRCWEWFVSILFIFFSFSLSLVHHPQNDETNCTRKEMRVEYSNSGIHLYTHSHYCHELLTDLSTYFFFFVFIFFFIVPDHEAERWLLILSTEYNKTWMRRIHRHILCSYQNQISMSFYLFCSILWVGFIRTHIKRMKLILLPLFETFFYTNPSIFHRKKIPWRPCLY